jgi:hypothetical protein
MHAAILSNWQTRFAHKLGGDAQLTLLHQQKRLAHESRIRTEWRGVVLMIRTDSQDRSLHRRAKSQGFETRIENFFTEKHSLVIEDQEF